KDQRAQIACVIFRNTLPPFAQPLKDGAQVQLYGQISVFEARGQYQLSVQILQSRGVGLLQARFEALKRKLEAEGLFDPAKKKPLPRFPRRIGIVTSPSGAAIRDMLNVLKRRAPRLEILINPVRVQGPGAAAEIAVAIREFSKTNVAWESLDLVVITRGGGSIEDLWEFNEEIVARAIYDAAIPIVSAVGHEVDFTIADFVADLRAPTPSAAAELIVPDSADLLRRVSELSACLDRNLRNFLLHTQTRLHFLSERALARELVSRLRDSHQRVDVANESLVRITSQSLLDLRNLLTSRAKAVLAHSPSQAIAGQREKLQNVERRFRVFPAQILKAYLQRLARAESLVRVLGPDATLGRGYSITTSEDGQLIRSISEAVPAQRIRTRLRDGEFASKVE
ncbi:MAG: exodeoxyribonuclease VII large subunit, partial [Verrucomicrobiota bacterium]|nr:exodeoxyribonuclease VII large subunit [Verrucomicrobiota bacterium]